MHHKSYVLQLQVEKPPDRETVTTVSLTIRAIDGDGRFSERNVAVTINDLNDNKPVFNPAFLSLTISEAASTGSLLHDFAVGSRLTDADSSTSNFNVITLTRQSVTPTARVCFINIQTFGDNIFTSDRNK